MSNPSSPPEVARPWAFLIAVLIVAVFVSAAVAYLGMTGLIGGGIPGTHAP